MTQKGLKFKIKNPERFHFEPRTLLSNIITMYTNMQKFDEFKQHIVNDGRSYSDETFEKAVKILNSTTKSIVIDPEIKERFESIAKELKQLQENKGPVSNLLSLTLCRNWKKMLQKSSLTLSWLHSCRTQSSCHLRTLS